MIMKGHQGVGTKSQYIMMAAAVTVMTFLSFYNLYHNFAVFKEMEIVQLYMQMQGMSTPPEHKRDEDSDNCCFEDINQILSNSKDKLCFDFHDTVWDRLSSGRQKLHPSFWESDIVSNCIDEDYELIGFTHGVHILVGAQPIVLGLCPTIAVDAIPGIFHKHVTFVPPRLLTENQKKRFLNFHNQMTLAQFRKAVDNARISIREDFSDSSSYNFMHNNCANFPLDILAWLGIDFKRVHREAVTTLVLKGLMSSKETTDKVMSVVRERLRGKIGGTVWATLNSEKAIFQRVISIYVDEHNSDAQSN